MKLSLKVILVLVAMSVAMPAAAGKIGFLDAEAAVAAVGEGKIQIKALEDWTNPRREVLEQMRTRVMELQNQLNAQSNVATPEVLAKLERDYLAAGREFEDAGRNFNRELDAKQNELLGEVAMKIGQVASEFGKANDYDAIFMFNAQPLAFIADAANVTDIVVRLYNEKYPVD